MRRERAVVAFFLLCICLVLWHFIHEAYFVSAIELSTHPRSADVPVYHVFQQVQPLHAPDAYRVAIPALGRGLMHLFHLSAATVASLLDLLFAFLTTFTLYLVATHDAPIAPRLRRSLVIALLLAFIQLPIAWVIPWQRPETLPSSFFLAFSVYSFTRSRDGRLWFLAPVLLALWQGFVRSDIAFFLGASVILLSLLPGQPLGAFGTRGQNLLRGFGMCAAAVLVQLYLQLVRYPHLPYPPGTPVFVLSYNLTVHNISNLILAILPFAGLAWLVGTRRLRLLGVDALAGTVAALYLVAFVTVALVDEVRVYVPCMFLLCMVSARAIAAIVSASGQEEAA